MILENGLTEALGLATIYAVSCFIYGFLFYKFGWQITANEVGNQYNQFVHEMRKNYKNVKLIKGKKN